MLRTRALEVSLWEAVLPEEVLRLPEELARVDALLDDPVFFAPFTPFFDPRLGRPSTPMEVYLRLMFLKFRYRLGYETLCREVSDSITWRRFCRIPLDGPGADEARVKTTPPAPGRVTGLVQMRVGPAHRHLHHRVQPGQAQLPGNLHPAQHRRPHLPQLNLDLVDLRLRRHPAHRHAAMLPPPLPKPVRRHPTSEITS